MIHMNMQEISRVCLVQVSKICHVMRRLATDANKAVSAPMAELSTSEVQPFTKGTIIAAKIASGRIPAPRRRIFSARDT